MSPLQKDVFAFNSLNKCSPTALQTWDTAENEPEPLFGGVYMRCGDRQ